MGAAVGIAVAVLLAVFLSYRVWWALVALVALVVVQYTLFVKGWFD